MDSTSKSPLTPPVSPKGRKKAPATPTSKVRPAAPVVSPASVPVFETTTNYTQSARTYVSNFEQQKVKTKTRSDQASIFSNGGGETGSGAAGLISRLGFGEDKPAETKDDAGDQGKKGELRW